MQRFYDTHNQCLVYIGEAASPAFWDNLWQGHSLNYSKQHKPAYFVLNVTPKYLPKGSKILEGGCGLGQNVSGLKAMGFDSYGVDYTEKTVAYLKSEHPELKISLGDVHNLSQFSAGFFDGYWSLGVIEHFFEGYEQIRNEMHRVLRPGGILFLTVPSMSSVRKLKAAWGAYPKFDKTNFARDKFYQFALDPQRLVLDFEQHGFCLKKLANIDGVKGAKDEVTFLAPLLGPIYNGTSLPYKILRKILNLILSPFANHITLFVFERT